MREQRAAHPRGRGNTASVIRSCRSGSSAARSAAVERRAIARRDAEADAALDAARPRRARNSVAMSVAFDDHGEIVPGTRDHDEELAVVRALHRDRAAP